MSIKLEWEDMESNFGDVQRAKVFGGWLVKSVQDVFISLHEDQRPQTGYEWREAMVFVPDPKHEWENEEIKPECRHEHQHQIRGGPNNLVIAIDCLECKKRLHTLNRTSG